jgi:hypothetical protein
VMRLAGEGLDTQEVIERVRRARAEGKLPTPPASGSPLSGTKVGGEREGAGRPEGMATGAGE